MINEENKKILLVEDDDTTALIETRILERNSYQIDRAHSGEEALGLALAETSFDLILMDIDLGKGIDGTEAARRILTERDIPLVFLSSHTEPEIVKKTEGITSYGYIVKNSGETILIASIKMAFRLFYAKQEELLKEERVQHLNRILLAIRNVNQLIVREKNPARLIRETVDSLIETRGFFSAWIALFDESGEKFEIIAQAGLGERFDPVYEKLMEGTRINCTRVAFGNSGAQSIQSPGESCLDCPLHHDYPAKGAMTVNIEHAGKSYGVLTVSIPDQFTVDEQELSLLDEVAGDIAFALYNIEQEAEKERYQKMIRESEEKYQNLLKITPEGFWVIDKNRLTTDVNDALVQMIGYSREEMIGNNPLVFADEENQKIFKEQMGKIGEKNQRVYEVTLIKKNGDPLHVKVSATTLHDREGEILGGFAFFTDLTENRRIQDELRESNEQLQELNATKDKFFSIIAHDLRSPFHSILGFSDLLADASKNQRYNDTYDLSVKVNRAAQTAFDLLDNLLQWSRLQTGKIQFQPEEILLSDVLNNAARRLKTPLSEKKIDFQNQIPGNLRVRADAYMLEAVLRNLISNSIKFTNDGGIITVTGRKENGYVKASVQDNGIGIPEEDLERLFRIEENLSTTGTHEETGSGLGLILCKEFIEKHGGTIEAKSEKGKGSTFTFSVPINKNELSN